MILIGWDPGLAHLGYGVVEVSPTRSRVLAHGNIGESGQERPEDRLDLIATKIDGLLNRWCPDALGYENQAGVHVGKEADGQHASWSLKRVHEVTGMLRFAARCSLAEAIPVYTPAPQSIKIAVLGKGNRSADKAHVKFAIRKLFGVKCGEHAADAIACAVATLRQHRLAQRRYVAAASLIT